MRVSSDQLSAAVDKLRETMRLAQSVQLVLGAPVAGLLERSDSFFAQNDGDDCDGQTLALLLDECCLLQQKADELLDGYTDLLANEENEYLFTDTDAGSVASDRSSCNRASEDSSGAPWVPNTNAPEWHPVWLTKEAQGVDSLPKPGNGDSQVESTASLPRELGPNKTTAVSGETNKPSEGKTGQVGRKTCTEHCTSAKKKKKKKKKQGSKNAREQEKAQRPKEKKKRSTTRAQRWWHELTDVDPITVEPLAELPYAPFPLPVSGQSDTVHYFDGKSLAEYLVTTANFINPNNRQPLSRSTCVKLDAYLQKHKLPKYAVTESFDLSRSVNVEASSSTGEDALRRNATVVTRSLFSYGVPQGNTASGRSADGRLAGGYNDGNLHVVDSNEWVASQAHVLTDEEAFPAIPTSERPVNETAIPYESSLISRSRVSRPSWVAAHGRSAQAPLRDAEFPALSLRGQSTSASATPRASWRSASAAANIETQLAQEDEADESDRPKLRLLPKSATSSAKADGTASQGVFGDARPREEVLLARGASIEPFPSSPEKNTYGSLDLCPYVPSFLQLAREQGVRWVSKVEKQLREFCSSPKSEKSSVLKVANDVQRKLVLYLARNYYGLDAAPSDAQGEGHVVVFKQPNYGAPDHSVVATLLQFGEWLDAHGSRYSDVFEPKAPSRQLPRAADFSILILDMAVVGGGNVSSSALEGVLSPVARPSSYFQKRLDDSAVLLQVEDKAVARKLYMALKEPSRFPGISWEQVQWWPVSEAWASFQLSARKESNRNSGGDATAKSGKRKKRAMFLKNLQSMSSAEGGATRRLFSHQLVEAEEPSRPAFFGKFADLVDENESDASGDH